MGGRETREEGREGAREGWGGRETREEGRGGSEGRGREMREEGRGSEGRMGG